MPKLLRPNVERCFVSVVVVCSAFSFRSFLFIKTTLPLEVNTYLYFFMRHSLSTKKIDEKSFTIGDVIRVLIDDIIVMDIGHRIASI